MNIQVIWRKFIYYTLGKAYEKNAKPIQGQGKKQVDAIQSLNVPNKQLMSIKDLFPTNQRI